MRCRPQGDATWGRKPVTMMFEPGEGPECIAVQGVDRARDENLTAQDVPQWRILQTLKQMRRAIWTRKNTGRRVFRHAQDLTDLDMVRVFNRWVE